MAKVRTQADRRQNATVTDQHGRKYSVVLEKDTMHPCSPPNPKGWTPPLLNGRQPFIPPESYQSFPKGDPFSMRIDYDRWIADLEAAHRRFDEKISSSAVLLFGSAAAKMIEEKNVELMRYVGPPPMPVEPVKAARAGNKFALGLTDKMPEWAVPFFTAPPKVEQEFPDVDEYANEPEEPEDTNHDGFEDAVEDEDRFAELEEAIDPAAIGGKKVDPRRAKKRAGAKR